MGHGDKCLSWESGRMLEQLPRAVGESPALGGFKTHLDVALGDRVQQAWGGWGDGWTW